MTENKLIETEEEQLEYWNKTFVEKKNVGWGSIPDYEWFYKKRAALESVLEDNMTVLDICCGNFNVLDGIITSKNCKYIGIDGSIEIIEHNIKNYPDQTFEIQTISELIKTNVEKDILIAFDILFHISENKLYSNFVKWLFSQNAQYVLLTYHKTNKKEQDKTFSHFITRPFKTKQKDYDIVFETEFANRNDLKLLVYKKV